MRAATGGNWRQRALAIVALAVATAWSPARLAAQVPTEPPPAASLRPLQFPPFQEATLAGGLQVVVVENHELPIVSISVALPAGNRYEPVGREGLADLVAELLTKGTKTRTAEQIAAAIEGVGSSLNASADGDFLFVRTTVLTDHVNLAFDLIGDVVLNSTFPDSELELARTRMLSQLRLERSAPEAVADRFFAAQLYGDHPYGRRATEASVRAITAAGVREYAASRLRPRGTLLVLAGDVTLAQARQLAGRALRGWTGAPARAAASPAPPPARATGILLVHRPGSQQSNILIGNLAQRPGDAVYYSATLANRILGGGVDARLFLILREQKGWTYGSYSRIVRRQDRGYFQANAEVRTPVTDSALVELLHQLRRIRTEAVADSELVAAKGYLIGSFPRQIETPQQIAGQVTTVKLLGLGEAYLRTFRERLAALRPADLTRGARRTIHPDSSVIVVVGDGQQIYEQLRAIAPVRIVDVEGASLTPADLAPKAARLDLDPAQLASRSDSFRIVVQGNPMGVQVGTITRSPDSIVYVEQAAIGGFVEQRSVVVLDARTYAMRRADQTGRAGPQSMETHLIYSAGRVKGRATIPQPSGTPKTIEVDTTIVEGTIDDNAVALVVPALPLAAGKTFELMVFSSGEGTLKPLSVRVGDAESVTVPAGTFEAFKVELQGMQVPMAMYVSRDTPRRVVKIEGGPFVYELVK